MKDAFFRLPDQVCKQLRRRKKLRGNPPSYHKVRRFCKGIAKDVLYQWAEGRKARVEDISLTIRREVSTVNHLWQTDSP